MVRKKQQIDRAKKRTKGKGDEEEPEKDSTVSHALETLQSLVFQDDNDRCKSALLKELYKRAPLLAAAYCGHASSVEALLNAGNDVNVVTREGYNAIHLAVQKMNDIVFNEVWNKLEKLGRMENSLMVKNNKTLLHAAAEIGWDYCAAFLLGRSWKDVEQKSRDGRTPMMCAACEGHTEIVCRLLQAGAQIFTEDQRRISLLQSPSTSSRDHRNFYRDTLFRVLLFIRRQLEGGTELLLNNDVFVSLVACGRRSLSDPFVVGPLFHLCACLMYDKADYSKYVHIDMVEAFMRSGGLDLSLEVLCHKAEAYDFQCRCSALLPVLPAAELEEGLRWVREHIDELVRPFHVFSAKKDVLVYWVDGERVKTDVMWERFTEVFTRLHLEVRGTPLEFDVSAVEETELASDPSVPFVLLQGGAIKRKSPPPSPKKQSRKTPNKKAPKPRAVQALLQVTFNDDGRNANKGRRVPLNVPKTTEQAVAPPTKPVNVLAVMSMAPAVTPAALPLQGYANALKSNLPKEEPPLHLDEMLPPRFKFTGDGTRSPRKKREHASLPGASMSLENSCTSQPCIIITDSVSPSLRRVQSDPTLNSPKAKAAAQQKLAFLESNSFGKAVTDEVCERCRISQTAESPTVPMEAETNSAFNGEKRPSNEDSTVNQKEGTTLTAVHNSKTLPEKDAFAPGQTKRKLGCHRSHCLQEHLLRELTRSQKIKHSTANQDSSLTAMTLVQTMLRAFNSLLLKPIYKANTSLDPRIEAQPLFTVDRDAMDLDPTQDVKNQQPDKEVGNQELLKGDGAWSGSFANVASREIAYDDQANLSSTWLPESQRWKKAFVHVANSPISSLVAVNGFFYSEEVNNFLFGARNNERTTVHLGIAKNGREVLLKRVKFRSPKDFESAVARALKFKKLDLHHGNINETHVTWNSSSSLVYVLWHPQDRNMEQYRVMLDERKLPVVKWARMAMGQLLDALAFLHTRNEPIVHGRLKPSNILVSPRGTLLLADLAPPGVLQSIPLGIVRSNFYGSSRKMWDVCGPHRSTALFPRLIKASSSRNSSKGK
ncbi:uncharacterized protein LOC142775070 [Rhipicephalus microplus]|uniref:uncharacterized protein LOC142775070 n=1 Tax=Rhipicephalus microplus TaxID=6941 RepID=UPI003F6D6BDD